MQLLQQGYQSLQQGEFENAIDAFTASLAIKPGSGEAHRGRGTALFSLKRWAEALSDFRQAYDTDPTDLEAGIGLGMTLAMRFDVYGAIDVLEAVLKAHPTSARAHIQFALLYYRLVLPAKGKALMERALTLRPSLAERRFVEDWLKKEKQLDTKRFYRPDFEAFHRDQ